MGPCDVYELDAVEMKDRLCNALIRHKACFNLHLTGRQVGAIAVSMVGWFLLLIYVHPSEIVRLHGCRVDEHSTQGTHWRRKTRTMSIVQGVVVTRNDWRRSDDG
jgi:hypothetical protein